MRLIDADLLDEVLDDKFEGCYALDVNYIQDKIIPNIPTIDAVPRELYESMEATCYKLQQTLEESIRPKGKWIDAIDTGVEMLECSACESRIKKRNYAESVGTDGYNYCPHCGADMRRDDNK